MEKKEKNFSLDYIDIRILQQMQRDAARPISEIARAVDMSTTPCWRRIKRLRDAGVISATVALLDPEKVGLDFVAYVFVKLLLPSLANMEEFERRVSVWPEIVCCHRVTGAVDYLLKIVTSDMHAYDHLLRTRLLDLELVSDVQSRIVLATVKDVPSLPLR